MTRDEWIEAMARKMHDGPLCADDRYDDLLRDDWNIEWINEMATAAYDALDLDALLKAEGERVREMCARRADHLATRAANADGRTTDEIVFMTADHIADAIRALDIGGKADG